MSEGRDEIEITVDRPGSADVIGAYRALNPDAEQVDGLGEKGALRTSNKAGELIFIKDRIRFFVVLGSPSSSREALLILARAAAERM